MPRQKNKKTPGSPGRVFFKSTDLFFIAGFLLLAGLLWLFLKAGKETGKIAEVTIGRGDTQQILQISLAEDKVTHIQAALPVQLEVANGRIRFIHSVCPDHNCENAGWLSHEGDWAACLPAEVVVRVEEGL